MSGTIKGKDITMGWEDFVKEYQHEISPEGYSTAIEIAKRTGISIRNTRELLSRFRKESPDKCIKAFDKNGVVAWHYKD